ncbi:MAG: adenylate/guanylate cyclase domain-containing protein [Xanthobacteraceae bacterium]|jgi:adenylate cyclase
MMRVGRPSFETLLTTAFVLSGLAWGGYLGARQIEGDATGLDRLEHLTVDWRFALAGPRAAPRGVVIAAIDNDTVNAFSGYPLPRDGLARIIRGIAAYDPQAIALDILFLDAGRPEADGKLAEALGSAKSVVAAIGLFDNDGLPTQGAARFAAAGLALVPRTSGVLMPIAALGDVAQAGLVNLATDVVGVPRHVPMIFQAGGAIMPSFALAAASAALSTEPALGLDTVRLAGRTVSTDLGYHLPLRYYGPHGTIRQFSVAKVLRGELDPSEVRGQVVILGATAVAMGDTFATPFDRTVPGVEIMATAISNILAGDGLIRTPLVRRIDATAAVVLPALVVLLMAMRRSVLGLLLAAIALALWGASTIAAFAQGYWLSVAIPLGAALPVATGYGLARLVRDRHVARRLAGQRAELTRFQSPLLVEHIMGNPAFLAQPVHQDVAVVFVDLSGFTGVAEALGPGWTRELLAGFQELVERDVAELGGFVSSFMGDGAMIIFGLPQPRPDDAARALRATSQLGASISRWLEGLPPIVRDRLSVRIGGHFGPAVLSRLGPAHHQHVTATGDTVNVTSRLLEVAKQQHASVVVSEDLFGATGPADPFASGAAVGRSLEVDIRGREQPFRIRVLR